ncbi:head GIN domain-containing protein [uncultured Polaribacter sp.]|uniref:head GIN domain-containing protein n=1 Tax=uncultured Polaribacter sp. TaxID=174711 RepID=UPI00262CE8C3|nr:head GIN domain-containing protein [uncultured Polaribacter sp.]
MKKLSFICLFFIAFSAIAQTTVTKNLGDYTTLKVYNGIAVELIKSNEQKLEITGAKANMVKIKNVNNILRLSLPFSLKPEDNAAEGEVLIKLYYNSIINVIDANEGATITGKDFTQDKVEVNAQERAFINLTLKTTYVTVRASSGGIIKLSGTANSQEVSVDLYGIYHGYNLKTLNNATIKSGTGAKAEIFAGETLNAKVSFGGTIFYKGNPKVVKDKKVIGGIIEKKN